MGTPDGRDGEGSDRGSEVRVLIGGAPRRSVAWQIVPVAVVVFAVSLVSVAVARRVDSGPVVFVALCVAVFGAIGLWQAGGWVYQRWGWRHGAARPALRLTPAGIAFRPAAADDFVLVAGWGLLLTEIRLDTHDVQCWCAYSLTIEGLGELPSFLPVDERVGPSRAGALARRRAETATVEEPAVHVELLTNLLAHGTPIVLPLDGVDPDELDAADEDVRRWTFGRCGLVPRAGAD
ncbi:MAG: hypothetical protein S0880_32110 [Actinomycetota bacterium]|nr:hypothetical protein [Actinomycetota bacterium]